MALTKDNSLTPPNRGEVIVEEGVGTVKFQAFLEGLDTEVSNLQDEIINLAGTTQIVVSGTYQTSGNQVIICDGISTITLDPQAVDGTKVSIKRTAGEVVITAIALIDNSIEDLTLTRDNTGVDLVFVSESGSWFLF